MPNHAVTAAGEAMPAEKPMSKSIAATAAVTNRRNFLSATGGLLAASAAALVVDTPKATFAASEAPKGSEGLSCQIQTAEENPEFLRLAEEYARIEEDFRTASEERRAIIAEWHPKWPLAPDEIIDRWTRWTPRYDDAEKTITSSILIRAGNKEALSVRTAESFDRIIYEARRVLKGKAINIRKVDGRTRQEWEDLLAERLRQQAIAQGYEARCEEIRENSGYLRVDQQRRECVEKLVRIIEKMLNQPCLTKKGLLMKAHAVAVLSEDAVFYQDFGVGRYAGEKLARAFLRFEGVLA